MSVSLVTAPAVYPIELETAKLHLRVDHDTDNLLISDVLIPAAGGRAETETRRQLIRATWDLKLDTFPYRTSSGRQTAFAGGYIEIPKPPLVSVTWIKYVDTNGTLTTWDPSNYLVDAPAGPRCARGRVTLAYGRIWPITLYEANAVTVRFVAGYGLTPDAVPAQLTAAMLLDIGSLYENREEFVFSRGTAIELPSGASRTYRSFQSHSRVFAAVW